MKTRVDLLLLVITVKVASLSWRHFKRGLDIRTNVPLVLTLQLLSSRLRARMLTILISSMMETRFLEMHLENFTNLLLLITPLLPLKILSTRMTGRVGLNSLQRMEKHSRLLEMISP